MNETLIQALWITLLGMGLVFVALLLFLGLMWLITALPFAKEKAEAAQTASRAVEPLGAAGDTEKEAKARAAAVAVAVALAGQQQNKIAYFPMPETALVSAWQLGMRTRQMYQKGKTKR